MYFICDSNIKVLTPTTQPQHMTKCMPITLWQWQCTSNAMKNWRWKN